MTLPSDPRCPHCDRGAFNLVPPGRRVTIEEDEPRKLRELLRADIDHDRCPRCKVEWDLRPTVAVSFTTDATVVWTAGTLARTADEAVETAVARMRARGLVPHVVRVPDLDALRTAVTRRLGMRLDQLSALGETALQQWRLVRPPMVTALALAVEGSLAVPDGLARFGFTDPLPERRRFAVAFLQVRLWEAMAAAWAAGGPGRLQDDLDAYAVGGASGLPADVLMELLFDDEPPPGPYAGEAVRAAVARSLRVPNPSADAWAEIYLAHEVSCAVHAGGATEQMRAARVSSAFAAATVEYGSAWNPAAALLTFLTDGSGDGALPPRELGDACAAVGPALARAGHPGLLDALLETRLVSTLDGTADAADIVAEVLPFVRADSWPVAAALANLHLNRQLPERRAACTDAVAARLLDAVAPARRGTVVVWWARRLNLDRRFADTLRLLRDPPAAEGDLTPADQARLRGALATAVDSSGDPVEALSLWRQVLSLLDDAAGDLPDAERSLAPWARVNLADVLARTGSVDAALEVLGEVLDGAYGRDPELLAQMAALQRRCGRPETAERLLAEAARLAGPAARTDLTRLRGAVAMAGQGAPADAAAVVLSIPTAHDDDVLLAEAQAWAVILDRTADGPAGAAERVAQVMTRLGERAGIAEARGDVAQQAVLLGAAAHLDRRADTPRWGELVDLRRRHRLADVPEELIRAARARLEAGDRVGMRGLLHAVLPAMVARYGAVRDIGLLVNEPRALLRPLAGLTGRVAENAAPTDADLALLGELQRDALGRARTAHLRMQDDGGPAPQSGRRAALPPDLEPFTVVEWIRTGERSWRCIASRIEDGRRTAAYLRLPPTDPTVVRKRIRSRIDTWAIDSPGSPFAVPGWTDLAGSFVEELATVAGPDEHVVVLHEPVFGGLPWHVGIAGRWTVSYAAGWSHLLDVLDRPPAPPRAVGVALVPLAHESDENRAALTASARAACLAAAAAGVPVERPEPPRCDRRALTDVLRTVDTAVLLCHGYQNPRSEEVGWILARHGELPSGIPEGAADRGLVWRDCLTLARTPRVMLSAACSSGRAFDAGLGDRLGLFSALRPGGTAAMVAPAWDVDACAVLPVVDALVVRHLAGERLGAALRDAGRDAEKNGVPDWLAWSLALEGDWR